jgi:hypothetical protein
MGVVDDLINGIGKDAFLRNIEKTHQKRTGDPIFDALATDIFAHINAGDERLCSWNSDIKTVVGLYDQATEGTRNKIRDLEAYEGDLPEDKWRDDPANHKLKMTRLVASGNVDIVIEDFRFYAHTLQLGKSREQCIEEFKKAVPPLYAKFGVEFPNIPELEVVPVAVLEPQGFAQPEEVPVLEVPAQAGLPAAQPPVPLITGAGVPVGIQESDVKPDVPLPKVQEGYRRVPITIEDKGDGKQHVHLHLDRDKTLQENVPVSSGSGQMPDLTPFSKGWWLDPSKGLAAIGGGLVTAFVLGGGYWLWKKLTTPKKEKVKVYKRYYARAWDVYDD